MKGVTYGDPFLLSVLEGNLNNEMSEPDLSLIASVINEPKMVRTMVDGIREHGGADQLYLCIPIGRVWATNDDKDDGPYQVQSEFAETQIERMARAAAALG